ncbi:MAG: arylesterase [Marinomonas sp.]|jgi:acyl-CoA thioesterase-1|uniref:Acyl-CoA thioesterase-1 n=1 Tax=Marinomonas communis TaxID=28254 RepID=A0A4V3DGQ9_9GAMM|nr:arylesterase [Marinomonas sp.]RUM48961.1 MAG: arylesterase [Marinomonas sp.]RUM49463.1 MAG: arylesterase [Marinomonas sp.]TDR15251.1 acyl-CoA thioesterase-1 [Marinomonas communis]
MMSKLIVSLLCFFSIFAANAQAKTLMVFGDSLSAAYNLRQQQGWVSLLGEQINQSHPDITIINASISGETTQGGLARLPKLLETHQPTWVVLELGANDGLRGYPLNQAKQNLASMIELIQQHSADIVLLGNHLPSNYGRTYTTQFFNLYKELAEQYQIAYVPFMLENVALDSSLMQNDGLHPNAKGQPVVLNNITPTLLPLLNK